MNRRSTTVFALPGILAAIAGVGVAMSPLPASSQGFPGAMGGPPLEMMKRMCEDKPAHFAGRMAFIMTKVGIRQEQRGAWDQFIASARTAEAAFDPCKDGPPPFNDPVAMRARMDQMHEKGSEAHRIMKAAADKLAAGLDPDQQRKLAEALLPPPGMRPPMMAPGGPF